MPGNRADAASRNEPSKVSQRREYVEFFAADGISDLQPVGPSFLFAIPEYTVTGHKMSQPASA
jgi:hypothetical protein